MFGATRQKARPGESRPGNRMRRQSRSSRPRRQRHPEGAARGPEPTPGAALNGSGQPRCHGRGPERPAMGHRKENSGQGLDGTWVAVRVTRTRAPPGAVPAAGRASVTSRMPLIRQPLPGRAAGPAKGPGPCTWEPVVTSVKDRNVRAGRSLAVGAARGLEPIPGAASPSGAGRLVCQSVGQANGPEPRRSRSERIRGTGQRARANLSLRPSWSFSRTGRRARAIRESRSIGRSSDLAGRAGQESRMDSAFK